MSKWLDTRIHKPSPNSYNVYVVIFLLSKDSKITTTGYCGYMPCDNYTNGFWSEPMHTNLNQTGGEVLYWMEMPKQPSDVV